MEQRNEIVDWREEMERQAVAAAQMERPRGGKFVSMKGGLISYAGNPAPNNTIEGVVIASCIERAVWPSFDPDQVSGPSCYAFGHDEKTMVPHKDARSPFSPQCAGCKNDEWGSSSSGGRGKECRTMRRLALLPIAAMDSEEGVLAEELYFIRIPTMSVANWQQHVHLCAAVAKMPPHGVITAITCRPDPKSMFRVHFNMKGKVAPELLGAILKRRSLLGDEGLMFPYSTEISAMPAAPSGEAASPRKFSRKK